jgi:hypothetical protein
MLMNDTELDRLLNAWRAPDPGRELREKIGAATVRERYTNLRNQRTAPLRSRLRWVVAVGVAFAALTVAMGQSGQPSVGSRLAQTLTDCWERIMFSIRVHRVQALVGQIMDSDPQVSVDGKPAPAVQRWHASTLLVQVPGDRAYYVSFFSLPRDGWQHTGQIRETYLDFEAGVHHVMIVCNRRLLISDSPIWVMRRAEP